MYHHYTVDEHSIRAIGLLARIEKGELNQDHPLSSDIIGKIAVDPKLRSPTRPVLIRATHNVLCTRGHPRPTLAST